MTAEAKSYSQMRREFYEKFQTKIVPWVRKYDNERKKKLVLAIISSGILAGLGLFLIFLLFSANKYGNAPTKSDMNLLKLAFALFAFSYFAWLGFKKSFENSIKEKIMPTVCSCFGNMKWTCEKYSGGKVFSSSCVIPEYESEEYDDIFYGSYKDVGIEIVEPEYDVGSGKNRRTVFDGVIIKLNMNKNFTSHTVVKPNSLMHISPNSELHHTELEDPEFNKKFDVYTNDDVDARYLLTPTFMERLKKMKTAFSASSVSCAFYGDLLIIAMPTNKDIFSICSLIKPVDDNRQYFRMYEEIVSIIKLIDHFKLNQKIGL